MIRLFNSDETNFNHVEMVLTDVFSFVTTEEENGQFIVEMSCPLDERIVEGKILKGPTVRGEQLFRIVKVTKQIPSRIMSVYGRHITYDLLNNFVLNVRPTETSQQNALNSILSAAEIPHRFTGSSDVIGNHTANYVRVNPIQAIMGNQANSLLNLWGGYLIRDNFDFKIIATSPDRGYDIRLGKNLIGLDEEVDTSEVVTRLYPTVVIEDNVVTTLPEKYVDSPHIGSYPDPIIKELRIELTEEEKILPIEQIYQIMRDRCADQFALNVDLPKTNYKVDFVQLRNTEQFKDLEILEELDISDTVWIYVPIIGTNLSARMIKYTYDGILNRFISMELGNFKPKLTDQRAEFKQLIEVATKDLTDGIITAKLKDAVEKIQGNRGGNVVTITQDSKPVALAFLDTDDINTANEFIIINNKGIAFGGNGLNNPPEVAINIDGSVVADSVFFRSLTTNLIQSELGSNLDLSSNESIRLIVEDINIGGKNLVKDSAKGWTSSIYNVVQGSLYEDWEVGQTYTISFKGTINEGQTFGLWRDTGTQNVITNIPYDSSRGIYRWTFVCPETVRAEKNLFSIYNYPSTGATSASIEWIKIEKGDIPTNWSPAPQELYTGITRIDKDGIQVSVSNSNVNTQIAHDGLSVFSGEDLLATFGGSGAQVPHLITESIVGDIINVLPQDVTLNVGSGKPFASITKALQSLDADGKRVRFLDGKTININVYGAINDNLIITDYIGGFIKINFTEGAKLNGRIYMSGVTSSVIIQGPSSSSYGTIAFDGTAEVLIDMFACTYVEIRYMNFDKGSGTTVTGIRYHDGSKGYVINCDFGTCQYGLRVYYGAVVTVVGTRGNCGTVSYYVVSGMLFARSTKPVGGMSYASGHYFPTGTISDSASTFATPPKVATTLTEDFYKSSMYTYVHGTTTKATYYGATAVQGKWETMSSFMDGYITFNREAYDFIQGGRDTTVKLYLYRSADAHGTSGPVTPDPDNFTASIGGATRGSWVSATISSSYLTSSGVTFKFYSPNVNTGYAIFSNAFLRVTTTKDI